MAAHDQTVTKNKIKTECPRPLCRLCRERKEKMSQVVTECKMLLCTQKQYHIQQPDRVGVTVNWVMYKRQIFKCNQRVWTQTRESARKWDC